MEQQRIFRPAQLTVAFRLKKSKKQQSYKPWRPPAETKAKQSAAWESLAKHCTKNLRHMITDEGGQKTETFEL
jgi:hypothetical protein